MSDNYKYTGEAVSKLNILFLEALKNSMHENGVDSLDNDLQVKLDNSGFTIFSTPTVMYVNYGRNPGTMPPTKDLEPWARKNNIPMSALFPIALKIAEDGTEGKDFIPEFNKEVKDSQQLLVNSMFKDIDIAIDKLNKQLK